MRVAGSTALATSVTELFLLARFNFPIFSLGQNRRGEAKSVLPEFEKSRWNRMLA